MGVFILILKSISEFYKKKIPREKEFLEILENSLDDVPQNYSAITPRLNDKNVFYL